jgi:hypothetical protein
MGSFNPQLWRETIAVCVRHPGALRQKEEAFLRDLAGFPRLSGIQRYAVIEIAEGVLGKEAA